MVRGASYEGDSSFVKDFPEVDKIDDYGRHMEIKLKEQSDPQELLIKIAGRIRINRFEVQEPTLNAIFIDKVGAKDEEDTVGH